MLLTQLTAIANEEGTDKGTIAPARPWSAHTSTDCYEACPSHFRERPIALREIGLGMGGSRWRAYSAEGRDAAGGAWLRMWYRDHARAQIAGVDGNPAIVCDNDYVCAATVDQGRVEELRAFVAAPNRDFVDVIVDDGSPRPDHQQLAWSVLFRHLPPGDPYFIEDLADDGLGARRCA